ncbi:hypothetical protein D3C72_1090740 [compost metagenome]
MALGRTGSHRHGAVTIVIDPVVAAAILDNRLDHLFIEALQPQPLGQLRLGALAASQTAHGKGAGGGKQFFKGEFNGFGGGFIDHK